jgi:hypothetical protein
MEQEAQRIEEIIEKANEGKIHLSENQIHK